MTKNIYVLFCFFLILNSFCFGQFTKGYIITLDEDTVNGFLRNTPGMGYERSVEFKPLRKGAEQVIFTADEIKGFFLYPTLHFAGFMSPIPQDSMKNYFYEIIHEGPISVYMLELSDEPMYFISKNGGGLRMLISDEKTYIEQLNSITSDCPTFRLGKSFYLNRASLAKIAFKYERALAKSKQNE